MGGFFTISLKEGYFFFAFFVTFFFAGIGVNLIDDLSKLI